MNLISCVRGGGLLTLTLVLSACGGGGGGTTSAAAAVLSNYVSSFSSPSPTSRVRAWEAYSVTPQVNYVKPNSELTFKLTSPVQGVSMNASTGELAVSSTAEFPGCVDVELHWPKTAESLKAQACADKEYMGVSYGLSKAGNNAIPTENGERVLVVSKSDPAVISFNLSLDYFDRKKNELVIGGGVFPEGSTTICTVPATSVPTSVAADPLPSVINTLVGYQLNMDWTTVSKGNYSVNIQCGLKVGLVTINKLVQQKIRLID